MNLIDRMFPRFAAHRRAALAAEMMPIVRAALEGSGHRSYSGAKWAGGLDSGAPSSVDHWDLRQNARAVCLESPEARVLINRSTDLVVGPGATLNLEPRYELLGLTPEAAEEWARNAELLFDLWASSPDQCRSGTMCFYEAMRLLYKGRRRDNEFFIRLYYSQDPSLILPLQFELLDPNQIRGDAISSLGLTAYQDDGIERDDSGRETAFKVWIQRAALRFDSVTIPKYGPKSKRQYMIHGFVPEYAGQGRGYSELGLDIQDYKNLVDLKAANVRKAINQSQVPFTVESKHGPATNPFENIGNGGAGPAAFGVPVPGANPEASGSPATPPYTPIHEAALSSPGSIGVFNLDEGQTLKPFANTAPIDSFESFVKSELSSVYSAAGLPLEVAFMSFKNNYSASQATLLLNNLNNDVELFLLAAQALDPVLLAFFSVAIAAGKISAPGWQDPLLRAAWLAHRWDRPPMPNIDREKSMRADKGYAELGSTTLTDIAMKLSGASYRSNISRNRREFAELPTPPWGWGGAGAAAPTEKPDKEETEDDDKETDD